MEYTVNKLAQISGVSARTLRYYDQIGLLAPARISANGYRIYGVGEVDRLQQILFYRELGMPLEGIAKILADKTFDPQKALVGHLKSLQIKRTQIDLLIDNVTRTIGAFKEETIMSDKQKFEGFKTKLIEENEAKYGAEIRQKYSGEKIDASSVKLSGMSEEKWLECEKIRTECESLLKKAFELGDPASADAQTACGLHKQWLCFFWPDGTYSKEAHIGLAEMYVNDERFTKYYNQIAEGCAEFLLSAIKIFCK